MRQGTTILDTVDLDLPAREHLAVLGPNGSGKTTLLRVLSTYLFPTRGEVEVLGARFGRSDLRALRPRIGFVSTALDPLLRTSATARALVAAAAYGATWPSPRHLADPDVAAATDRALARVGAGALADRRADTLSQGEGQRVRIARSLVGGNGAPGAPSAGPELVLLDEPLAGLDLGGRESLLADLDQMLAAPDAPTVVLVTHHLEEIPAGVRRALLLREGRLVAGGPVDEVLTDGHVSAAFGLDVVVRREAGRHTARLR